MISTTSLQTFLSFIHLTNSLREPALCQVWVTVNSTCSPDVLVWMLE